MSRYFSLEVKGHRYGLIRRSDDGGLLEYVDRNGLWVEDPELIDYFVGEGYSGPDPDLVELDEQQAQRQAADLGASLR